MQLAKALEWRPNSPKRKSFTGGVIEKDKTLQSAYIELYRLLMFQGRPADAEQVV